MLAQIIWFIPKYAHRSIELLVESLDAWSTAPKLIQVRLPGIAAI